jgi:FMN phosphatase YigB (HAD superfamily)
MEIVASTLSIEPIKLQIHADQLSTLLDQYAHKIKILSLDCFDTLLWRKTATPADVFFDLQHKPSFQAIGMTPKLRAQAEELARRKMQLASGTTEVKLKDIYLTSFPDLHADFLNSLAAEELAAELDCCYAFPPMMDLLQKAHSKGLKIIIVSDTYFDEKQLRCLLQKCLPDEILQKISKVFSSCEYSKSKSSGLFKDVFEKMNEQPQSILHLGDNLQADFIAAQIYGMHAAHFIHHDQNVDTLLRMQGLSGAFLEPEIRFKRSLSSPFRGIFATGKYFSAKAESTIGYASIGPIMYAFGHFINDEIAKLQRERKRPKVLFLMRDAYLPSLVCETLAGKKIGSRIRISRFASFAASFKSPADIDRYLAENVYSLRFEDLCKQLLLPTDLTLRLCASVIKKNNPALAFIKLIHQKQILELICKNSLAYRNRLKQHLIKEIGLEKGDTLVFVDLGYSGTSQLKLEPLFREEIGIEVTGRYLIALSVPGWKNSRKGLLDPSWCDERALQTLVSYIALVEQICTNNEQSVVDYKNDGTPVYSETAVSKQQHQKLLSIQAECLRFVEEAEIFFKQAQTSLSIEILRDTAMAELGRLLFFPTEPELQYLNSFEFELNLGTKDLLGLFDQEKGLAGLRRRGLFFMEQNLKSMRTNYPAELRTAGLELVLTLVAQHRFNFDIRVTDLSLRREMLHIIAIGKGKATQVPIEALPTHDGYFSLIVPVGTGNFQIGIPFGHYYQWIQLESAELILINALYSSKESEQTIDASENLIADQMIAKGGGLYECPSDTSLLIFTPKQSLGKQNYGLRIVFRPIVTKSQKPTF